MNNDHDLPLEISHGSEHHFQWEVQYARFFTFPHSSPPSSSSSSSSTRSLLRPIFPATKRKIKGTWLTSSSSNITLRLLSHYNSPFQQPILLVFLSNTIFEEHYVSKLHFTWPQVSCLASYAERGSNVIFVSYRDSTHQIQKFALRFSSSTESQAFIELLKCLREGRKVDYLSNLTSSMFHQSDMESNGNPSLEYTPVWQPSVPSSCSQEVVLSHTAEDPAATLPPSFTALLNESYATDSGATQMPVEHDLNDFLNVGSTADYAFIDMVDKIECVIIALGGDLAF